MFLVRAANTKNSFVWNFNSIAALEIRLCRITAAKLGVIFEL
jgi:hypothetical protein